MTRAQVRPPRCAHCSLAIVPCEHGTACRFRGWRHAGAPGGEHCCIGGTLPAEPGTARAEPPAHAPPDPGDGATACERAAAGALLAMARDDGGDFPIRLAIVLAAVAAELGSTSALAGRSPGSWEAALVLRLVRGNTGWGDDHHLPDYRISGLADAR